MKKTFCLLLAGLLLLELAACGAPAETETPSVEVSQTETPEVVTFADPLLESMVREAMGIPEDDIAAEDAEAVTELVLSINYQQEPAEGTQIEDLGGLEYFTGLENLELHFHAITDISPLSGLTNLISLSLGGNPVADLTPLSGLTNVSSLTLYNCQAEDYSPLENLVNLDSLWLEYSMIVDLTPLSGLTNLERLTLVGTQVSDVSPLAGLASLKVLSLADCPITDYSPLADIYPNLEEKDFTLVSSLMELGFKPLDNDPAMAGYKTDDLIVLINHTEWGETSAMDMNAVRMTPDYTNERHFSITYYPEDMRYIVAIEGGDSKQFEYV